MTSRLASSIAIGLACAACAGRSAHAPSSSPSTPAPAAAAPAPAGGPPAAEAPTGGVVLASPPPAGASVDPAAQAEFQAMAAAMADEPPVPAQPPTTGIAECDRYAAVLVEVMRCAPPGTGLRGRLADSLAAMVAAVHAIPASSPAARAQAVDGCATGATALAAALPSLGCAQP